MSVEHPARPTVPPGWYQDPWQAGALRYFDGNAWTAHLVVRALPQPPAPPLETLHHPAFRVALVAILVVVVTGRVVDGAIGRAVTTLTAFEILQWGFYVYVYGGLTLVVVWVWHRYGSVPFRRNLGVSFRWSDLGWGPVLFIVARMVQLGITLPLTTIPGMSESTERYSDAMRSQPTEMLITLVVVGVFVAPVVEELVFRGVLLRSLLARFGAPIAAVAQGVLFGCYHFAPSLGLYNAVLITANSAFGVLFGFVALKRRSLGTGMVAHALTNASVFAFIVAAR